MILKEIDAKKIDPYLENNGVRVGLSDDERINKKSKTKKKDCC